MSELTQLGAKVDIAGSPEEAILEVIDVPNQLGINSTIRMSCPEFTSLCPKTGQPDFAKIYLDYIPSLKLVESKSLKLFLCSFRNHGAFHEDCTNYIGVRLRDALHPRWLRLTAVWYPRGGISIDCFWSTGAFPQGYHLPRLHTPPYEGR